MWVLSFESIINLEMFISVTSFPSQVSMSNSNGRFKFLETAKDLPTISEFR